MWPRLEVMESMGREVGIRQAEFAGIVDAVRAAVGRWGVFARQAGVPKDLAAEAGAWHRRIREHAIPDRG